MDIIVRKMEADEAAIVKRVAWRAFTGIEKLFIGKPREAMVATLDGRIVGGIILKYMEADGKKIGYFEGAFVDPAYHGQSIGGALYSATTEYLWTQGCTALTAVVKDDNVPSWGLLLGNDFQRVSLREGVRALGFRQMLGQYFRTTFCIANGMEFYLAVRDGAVAPKKSGTVSQIALYLIINVLLALFAIRGVANLGMFLGAYVALLLGGVLFGNMGTLFSERAWTFRLNSGGAGMTALVSLFGGAYPMLGNWYPATYENTQEFRKHMGLVALFEWLFVLGATALACFGGAAHHFAQYVTQLGSMFLIYRVLAVYPFEIYGGLRVLLWDKRLYGVMSVLSATVIVLTGL